MAEILFILIVLGWLAFKLAWLRVILGFAWEGVVFVLKVVLSPVTLLLKALGGRKDA